MDSFDDDPFELSCLSSSKDDETVENVHDLLEEGWFFGQFLTSKPRMLRSYSDPSPNIDQQILAEKSNSSSKKSAASNLIRLPSLLPCIGRREENIEDKERKRKDSGRMSSKLTRQLSDLSLAQQCNNNQAFTGRVEGIQYKQKSKMMTGQSSKHKLLRTPSLPPCTGREEIAEEHDTDITMSRLIREAMPVSSEILPPPTHISKSASQYRPPKNMKDLGYSNQRSLKKSLSNVESQEVQVFKDLGLTFNKKDKENEEKVKRGYLYEAWHVQSCATPPIPIWANKNSAEDMKLQLKCWARAVASNVR